MPAGTLKPNSAGVLSVPLVTEHAATLLAELTLDDDSTPALDDSGLKLDDVAAMLLALLNEDDAFDDLEDFDDFDDLEDLDDFEDFDEDALEDFEDFEDLEDLALDDFTDLATLLELLPAALAGAALAGIAITNANKLLAITFRYFIGFIS